MRRANCTYAPIFVAVLLLSTGMAVAGVQPSTADVGIQSSTAEASVTQSQTASSAQVKAPETNVSVGGPMDDEFNAVVRSADGGYVLAGEFGAGPLEEGDPWIVKVDSTGSVVWNVTVSFGTFSQGRFNDIVRTDDGGYLAVGGVESDDGAIAVKFTPEGTVQWKERYSFDGNSSVALDVVETDSGYVLAGSTYSGPQNASTGYTQTNGLVVKIADDGTAQWKRAYGFPDKSDEISSVFRTDNGSYRFFGGSGSVRQWFGLVGSDGRLIQNETVSTSQRTTDPSGVVETDSGYTVLGMSGSGLFTQNVQLLTVDDSGTVQNEQVYELGLRIATSYGVTQTNDGGYAVAVETDSTPIYTGGTTGHVLKIGPDGDREWFVSLGPANHSSIRDVTTGGDSSIVFGGMINTSDNTDGWFGTTSGGSTQTATPTATRTPSPTETQSPTVTPSASVTPSATSTPSASATQSPTETTSAVPTDSPTSTESTTPTETATEQTAGGGSTSTSGPGLGSIVALVSLLATLVLVRRRH